MPRQPTDERILVSDIFHVDEPRRARGPALGNWPEPAREVPVYAAGAAR